MAKLRDLLLIPAILGSTASVDSQKFEDIIAGASESKVNYSLSAENTQQQQQNGYLDYLAAIDFLAKNNFEKKLNMGLGKITGRKSTYLKEIKMLVTEYARAIDMVKQGNRKQVFADTLFFEASGDMQKVESSTFNLSTLLFYDSYQNFASGNPAKGTQSFIDTLTFGEKIAGAGGIRNYMRGSSLESIAFNEAENLLQRMSQTDLKRIEAFSSDALKYEPLGSMLQKRLPQQLVLIEWAISGSYRGLAREGNVIDEEIAKTVAEQVSKLNPVQRQALRDEANKAFVNYVNSYLNLLAKPESEWNPIEMPNIHIPTFGNLNTLFDLVDSPVTPVLFTAARQRAQYRLLFLHSKIEQYKWEHTKLPSSLEELKDPKSIYDPLSGENFVYKQKEGGSGYDLYSNGSKNPEFQTEKIFLAPKRRE